MSLTVSTEYIAEPNSETALSAPLAADGLSHEDIATPGEATQHADNPLASVESVSSDVPAARNIGSTALGRKIRSAWLELTSKCDLRCTHCYAESGPQGTHGTMTEGQWISTIDQLAEVGAEMVQFIGGEPTLHPSLPKLIGRALAKGMHVQVHSNLTHISEPMWATLSQAGVSLATSYYSPDRGEHEAVTQRRGSHKRTVSNIQRALQRGIPLQVGIIGVNEGQNVDGAKAELIEFGVPPDRIGVDYLRQVGRGIRDQEPSTDQLCGHCTDGVLAVMPDGSVQPCVFTRWPELKVGNIQDTSLKDILETEDYARAQAKLSTAFDRRARTDGPNARSQPGAAVGEVESTESCPPLCTPTFCAPDASTCTPHDKPPVVVREDRLVV